MPHYIKLDENDYIIEVLLSDAQPTHGRYVQVGTVPPPGLFHATKWRFDDGEFVDTGEPWHTPTYAHLRQAEYPPIGDQLDALWKIVASLGTVMTPARDILAQIQEVKNKYPKQANNQ